MDLLEILIIIKIKYITIFVSKINAIILTITVREYLRDILANSLA